MMEPLQPSAVQDRRPSPHLTLELSSNNPFRNRTTSPSLDTPGSIHSLPGNRPVSRNPFLANFEQDPAVSPNTQPRSPFFDNMAHQASPTKADLGSHGSHVDELFKNLTVNGNDAERRGSDSKLRAPPRAGTLPPPQSHRPSRSRGEEDMKRVARPPRPRGPPGERRPFDSPERRENRRPRRNSESSIIDKGSLTVEDDRKRRERRRERERERERERGDRTKDGKSREGRSQRTRKPHGLDTIDKLDVTGLYGVGLFHHDGPFDACNPHRNRKKDHKAPMQAFPDGSANMALGGSGPLNKNIDYDRIHGRGADAFGDYNTTGTGKDPLRQTAAQRQAPFNPKSNVEPVHGEESLGLGTSTFLEGSIASRSAMQRRESENEAAALQGAGLSRKKSLAQRIRGISQPRRGFGDGAPRIGSGDAKYGNGATSPGEHWPIPKAAQSAGGMTKANETNPFFDEYDEAYETKGTTIKIAEDAKTGRPRAPSSPMRNVLERKLTGDSNEDREGKAGSNGGLLGRMKSLNRGKRTRPERPERPAPERPMA